MLSAKEELINTRTPNQSCLYVRQFTRRVKERERREKRERERTCTTFGKEKLNTITNYKKASPNYNTTKLSIKSIRALPSLLVRQRL